MTGAARAQSHLVALAKPTESLLTVVIVAAVVLLLFFLMLRHFVRKQGGQRRFRRRIAREAALTRRAFGEPLRAFRRHRRGARALARQLSEPRHSVLVRRLLDAAGAALADVPGAFPYALRMAPGSATVQIAARRLPEPLAPWEAAEDSGPQSWQLPLASDTTLPEAVPRPGTRVRSLPVAVGMADDVCVHLDLAAGARLITIEGDRAARLRLLQALAAQLDRPGSGASVTVTDGVHPHHRGQRLDAVLRRLEDPPAQETGELGHAAVTEVVVCTAPTREQARRLGVLVASGTVVCLADGRVAGHSWALRVDARGRVTAPELGLDADSAPLSRAVAAAVRADRRRARRIRARPRAAVGPQPWRQGGHESGKVPQGPVPTASEPAVAGSRPITGSDLLSEPAGTREHSTYASSSAEE